MIMGSMLFHIDLAWEGGGGARGLVERGREVFCIYIAPLIILWSLHFVDPATGVHMQTVERL